MDNLDSGSVPIQFSPSYAFVRTIYGFGASDSKIFKSTDAGDTWENLPIPVKNIQWGDWITIVNLIRLILNKYPILIFIVALLVTLLSYLVLGHFRSKQNGLSVGRR